MKRLRDILDIMFKNTNADFDDGKNVFNATKKWLFLANKYDSSKLGCRINMELCGIEFKKQTAEDSKIAHQQ